MPQLPADFRRRYSQLGLPVADVLVLADELPTAHYFEAVLAAGAPAKPAANWVMGDIMAFCKVCLHDAVPLLVWQTTRLQLKIGLASPIINWAELWLVLAGTMQVCKCAHNSAD